MRRSEEHTTVRFTAAIPACCNALGIAHGRWLFITWLAQLIDSMIDQGMIEAASASRAIDVPPP
jgi:hypothetical protein